jgi:hypothetical protein
VVASATFLREESDQDLHVILRVGSRSMIAEAPNAPFCTAHATVYRKKQMRTARIRVRSYCARARVVGVPFFDYYHGQRGVAPNAIELHPILGYRCLSGGKPLRRRRQAGSAPRPTRPSASPRRRRISIAATSDTATSACSGTWRTRTLTISTVTTTGSAARRRA